MVKKKKQLVAKTRGDLEIERAMSVYQALLRELAELGDPDPRTSIEKAFQRGVAAPLANTVRECVVEKGDRWFRDDPKFRAAIMHLVVHAFQEPQCGFLEPEPEEIEEPLTMVLKRADEVLDAYSNEKCSMIELALQYWNFPDSRRVLTYWIRPMPRVSGQEIPRRSSSQADVREACGIAFPILVTDGVLRRNWYEFVFDDQESWHISNGLYFAGDFSLALCQTNERAPVATSLGRDRRMKNLRERGYVAALICSDRGEDNGLYYADSVFLFTEEQWSELNAILT